MTFFLLISKRRDSLSTQSPVVLSFGNKSGVYTLQNGQNTGSWGRMVWSCLHLSCPFFGRCALRKGIFQGACLSLFSPMWTVRGSSRETHPCPPAPYTLPVIAVHGPAGCSFISGHTLGAWRWELGARSQELGSWRWKQGTGHPRQQPILSQLLLVEDQQ